MQHVRRCFGGTCGRTSGGTPLDVRRERAMCAQLRCVTSHMGYSARECRSSGCFYALRRGSHGFLRGLEVTPLWMLLCFPVKKREFYYILS